jgi:hypothetical protein
MLPFSHLLLLTVASFVSSSALPPITPALSTPLPPSQDPWYTAPPNYQFKEPGTIFRIRHAPGNLTSIVVNSSAAYNILYRSTDSNYLPTWAVTTLYIPTTTHTNKPKSLLSYQYPYNSPDVDASPSYAWLKGVPISDVSVALGQGWFVNVPDFEGLLASFTCGVSSGHMTLDSIRAVLSANLGVNHDTRYAMWGYSGGSIASEWAAELQPKYAPELRFAGAAIGGVISNGLSALETVNGGLEAILVPFSFLGLATQHEKFRNFLHDKLKKTGPYNASTIYAFAKMDFNTGLSLFAFQNIYNYFVNGEADYRDPIVQNLGVEEALMGRHGIPRMQMFVYKAVGDEVSKIGDTDVMVEEYCRKGVDVVYQRNSVGGHLDESINGAPRAVEWLGRVLEGRYRHVGCTVKNVTVSVGG